MKAISAELFSKKLKQKGISAVIATIMLLMITVAMIGVFYAFSSTMATTTTSSGSEQASQLTSQLSSCMMIENIINNQISLRNCGKGIIDNKSLIITIDEIKLAANASTINEGSSGTINITGLWNIPLGKHNLKISNGAAVAQALVDIQPNPDGLVGSWSFEEGSGNVTYDTSGNRNTGILTNGPAWVDGRFGKGLQFDGTNDYVSINPAGSTTGTFTVGAWAMVKDNSVRNVFDTRGPTNYGFDMKFQNGNRIHGDIGNGTVWITTGADGYFNYQLNTWYYLAYVITPASYTIYLNGNQIGSGSYPQSTPVLFDDNHNINIGRHSAGSEYFNGTIDEVRIWNISLMPDQTVVMKQII